MAAQQAEWNAEYQKVREGKVAEAATATGEEGSPAGSPKPEPSPDVAKAAEPVARALSLDGDDAQTLTAFGESIAARSEQRVRAAEESAKQAHAMVGQVVAQQVRGELKAEWPDLAVPATWQRVREKARAISSGYPPGEDVSGAMRSLIKDAALLVLGPPGSKRPKKQAKGTDPRDVGKPTARATRKAPPAKRTPEQMARENARAILKRHNLREHPF